MNLNILVAILRDKDHIKPENINPKKIKRQDKIDFMTNKLGNQEIERIKKIIITDIGFEGEHIEIEVGNVLCKKFNEYIQKGGTYV